MLGLAISAIAHLPNFKGKHRLLKLVNHLPYTSATSKYGVKMLKNGNDVTYLLSLGGLYGNYISNIITQFKEPFFFLDIGANQGVFSILASKNENCERVYAFEPNPNTFELLKKNQQINDSKMSLYKAAIGEFEGQSVTFHFSPSHSGACSMVCEEGSETFKTILAGKTVFAQISTEVKGVGLCKIDVEGAEETVLKTLLASELGAKVKYLIVEMSTESGGQIHKKKRLPVLEDFGYKMVSRQGPGFHYDALFEKVQ